MAVNRVEQKTLYTNRKYHQPLSGEFGAIFDHSWSTVQNSPVFSNYVDGINVGSFKVQFNDGQNNNALVHSNGNWIPPKSGTGCLIKITEVVLPKGKIKNYSVINAGEGYKTGDRFSIIELGAVNGLVEVEKIAANGGVQSLKIINGGMGYKPSTNNIELNDLYWTRQEVLVNKTEDGEEETDAVINALEQEWKLKLDFKNFTSFALYGNLVELIKSSFLGIVNDFPGSLWLLKKEGYYEIHNPFNINIYTSNDDPYIDDIRVFQQNHRRYEIIETRWLESADSCKGSNTGIHLMEECERNIERVNANYRYIYVKKEGFIGYIGSVLTDNYNNIIVHENYDVGDYTLDNNDLIVTTEEISFDENVVIKWINDYYPVIRLLDNIEIKVEKLDNAICGNLNSFTIKINFNYDDKYNPCDLINYTARITGINDSGLLGFHIRPEKKYIDSFFNNLTDFQRVLLNRNTVPKYTSTFYVPMKDSNGSYTGMYTNESFTLDTQDGWNIDLDSVSYQRMIKTFLDAAEYMDTMKCDNIYRMLTHDSIKNLDWSLNRVEDEALAESYIVGESYLKKVLRIYGRCYDEIKKYIHGIEIINNLTYDQLDNYPDAILKTEVDIAGWKPVSVVNFDNTDIVTEQLFYGWQQKYTATDIENEFYRRLLLNSAHIASWKGTKHGVEMLMNLFGIERDKWELNEIVYVASGSSYGTTDTERDKTKMIPYEREITLNSNVIEEGYIYEVYSTEQNSYIKYNGIDYYSGDAFVGVKNNRNISKSGNVKLYFYPVKNIFMLNKMTFDTENGETSYTNEFSIEREYEREIQQNPQLPITKYYYDDYGVCKKCNGKGYDKNREICSRCNGLGKVRPYYGIPFFHGNTERLYYQQFGGWYQDTQAELKMVETIPDLINMIVRQGQEEGTLVYVRNDDEWKTHLSDNEKKESSHYWVLINSNNSINRVGWYNLRINEVSEEFTRDTANSGIITINVQAYFQVQTTNEGNNPHTGGTLGYDYGYSYLRHFGYEINDAANKSIAPRFSKRRGKVENPNGLFNYTLNNSPECMWDKPQYHLLENVGFKLNGYIDNKGCWAVYRNDILMTDDSYSIFRKYIEVDGNCTPVLITDRSINTRLVHTPNQIDFYRIVNCKNISFKYDSRDESESHFFINNIIPYLEALIPSTAIIDMDFGKPVMCGIGVMQMIPNLNAVGDQCEEIVGDKTAINKVAKIRNVPD